MRKMMMQIKRFAYEWRSSEFCLDHSWIVSINFCFLKLSSPFSLWTSRTGKILLQKKLRIPFCMLKYATANFKINSKRAGFFFVELSDFSPSFWEICTSDLWSRLFRNNNNNSALLAFCIFLFYLNQEHSFCISFKLINLNFTFAYVFFSSLVLLHLTPLHEIKLNCKTD